MVLAFTGHRPEKLPWGNDENDPRCQALKLQIRTKIREEIDKGAVTFLCGMARGCDFYFAEALLALQPEYPWVGLEAFLPCEGQSSRWGDADRQRYQSILARCNRIHMLQRSYSDGCMLRRNRKMVECADGLMSVWDGSVGGTAATVRYALRQNKPVIALWL